MMMDKLFLVKLERTRAYWDYYKMVFLILCLTFIGLIISSAIIYHKGEMSMMTVAGVSALFFLTILLLLAVMSLIIWSFENKHLHELLTEEGEKPLEEQPVKEEDMEFPLV